MRVSSKCPWQALCHTTPTLRSHLQLARIKEVSAARLALARRTAAEQSCRIIGMCRNGGASLVSEIAAQALMERNEKLLKASAFYAAAVAQGIFRVRLTRNPLRLTRSPRVVGAKIPEMSF